MSVPMMPAAPGADAPRVDANALVPKLQELAHRTARRGDVQDALLLLAVTVALTSGAATATPTLGG